MYTTIRTSKEQAEKLLSKHLKKFMGFSRVKSKSFSYNNEDDIGFVTLHTITGKKICYQLRNDIPMFVEFTGFGNIRYDISYPENLNQEMFEILKKYGIKAKNDFWKGGEI
ncbi:MAG: hypothetical protein ACOCVF_00040 [bacterium]